MRVVEPSEADQLTMVVTAINIKKQLLESRHGPGKTASVAIG